MILSQFSSPSREEPSSSLATEEIKKMREIAQSLAENSSLLKQEFSRERNIQPSYTQNPFVSEEEMQNPPISKEDHDNLMRFISQKSRAITQEISNLLSIVNALPVYGVTVSDTEFLLKLKGNLIKEKMEMENMQNYAANIVQKTQTIKNDKESNLERPSESEKYINLDKKS